MRNRYAEAGAVARLHILQLIGAMAVPRLLEDGVLLAARVLLSTIFLHEAAVLLAAGNFAATAAALGIPAALFLATIALQLVAGLAILTGGYTRLGAAALGGFCLATAVLFHTNFGVRNELLHFEKDLAIAGGMFVLMVHGPGGWSLDRHLGRK